MTTEQLIKDIYNTVDNALSDSILFYIDEYSHTLSVEDICNMFRMGLLKLLAEIYEEKNT